MKALQIKVSGRVQGVYFRASTRDMAQSLEVSGWCKNEADGSVLIHAEGKPEALEKLVQWCHQGPVLASVKKVETVKTDFEGFADFVIRRF